MNCILYIRGKYLHSNTKDDAEYLFSTISNCKRVLVVEDTEKFIIKMLELYTMETYLQGNMYVGNELLSPVKESPFTQIEEKVTLINPFTELETVNDYQKALQCVCRV